MRLLRRSSISAGPYPIPCILKVHVSVEVECGCSTSNENDRHTSDTAYQTRCKSEEIPLCNDTQEADLKGMGTQFDDQNSAVEGMD
jgi:hypothetical protein